MTEVAETVAKEGVALAYHHHMGTVVQSGEDIDAFMESTGNAVKLLLDTGHATFGGADPVALAKKYRTRIAHVHCKDVRKDVLATARGQGLELPGRGGGRLLHRAGRRHGQLPGLSSRSCPAIPAGWWWKPSRTRKRPIR